MAFSHIGGAEPSTVTFKVGTVTVTRNSSNMHQELITIADPVASSGLIRVLSAPMASTEFGLGVRIISGPSSAADCAVRALLSSTSADNPVTISGNSTVVISAFAAALISTSVQTSASSGLNVRIVGGVSSAADFPVRALLSSTNTDNPVRPVFSSTNTDNPVRAVLSSTNTDNPIRAWQGVGNSSGGDAWPTCAVDSSNAIVKPGDSGNNAVRVNVVAGGSTIVTVSNLGTSSGIPSSGSSGVVVRQVWDIRKVAASSNAFASTSLSINSSVAGVNIYVTAYSITSTTAGPNALKFYSSGTMIWPIITAAVSSAITGANLAAYPYIFKTNNAGEAMTLQVASSIAGFKVGVSYFLAP